MSRNNEFFHACKIDNWYIFEHTEYEWDDIVNAFIAGGLYADKNPRIQWVKLTDESVKELFDYARSLVYRADYDESLTERPLRKLSAKGNTPMPN